MNLSSAIMRIVRHPPPKRWSAPGNARSRLLNGVTVAQRVLWEQRSE
jgi:hypothetical protein